MTIENQNEAVVTAPESESTAAPDTAITQTPEEQEPKTFTQEELDRIVAAEKAKAKRKAERELREELAQQQQQRQLTQVPTRDQFATDADFVDALAEHKANQKLAEREAQKQQNQVVTKYADRVESFVEKNPDYFDVAHGDHVRITPEMAEVIQESEVGPQVAYHLGKNPDEALRISKLPPLAQAREIGKIEATFASNAPQVKKVSSAPEPIKPVGSRTTAPSVSTSDPRSVKQMSDSEWIAQRNAEIAKKYS
jgi:hypothetical protein